MQVLKLLNDNILKIGLLVSITLFSIDLFVYGCNLNLPIKECWLAFIIVPGMSFVSYMIGRCEQYDADRNMMISILQDNLTILKGMKDFIDSIPETPECPQNTENS